MDGQQLIIDRIKDLCREKNMSYYMLSYRSTVPLTTLLHILDGSTKNPGIFTILKLCNGLGISIIEFFDTEELKDIEYNLD
ncbi:MAG TPA: helix-turn-helix transcriptional regulator [Candidatus Choladousia intestinigallinarum]|nr:helix-turn-helix transcriptional regulator [Candidatus Choladousia intestinigallinarum]